MQDYGLSPEPPYWAINAGLPEPREDESFCGYVDRLGLDCSELLVELTPQTIMLANYRLATTLQYKMREAFDAHVDALAKVHIEPSRRRELRRAAELLFPGRCRPGPLV